MKRHQVVGIGNALVDVVEHVDSDFLDLHGVQKGIMQLVDRERAAFLGSLMRDPSLVAGGSAANTVAGLSALGISTAFIGKICDDALGQAFSDGLKQLGFTDATAVAPTADAFDTGRCTVLVTPDGERSMNTYLGASEFLASSDIDENLLGGAQWVFLEGYRFDGPGSQAAFRKAVRACRSTGGKVAVTLSDPFCVERHREAFRSLGDDGIGILFCNEAELLAMQQTRNLDTALDEAVRWVEIVACTRSGNGATIARKDERHAVSAFDVDVVDATGAGDLFAAGFLYGILQDLGLARAGQIGCAAAAETIARVGARPGSRLRPGLLNRGLIQYCAE